jgi:hypothetical protein
MGYTTMFDGQVAVEPPLCADEIISPESRAVSTSVFCAMAFSMRKTARQIGAC